MPIPIKSSRREKVILQATALDAEGEGGATSMQRGPWIIGGSIVLAAAILAVALLAMNGGKSAQPVETRDSSDARISETERVAHDRSSQADLRNALVVAKVYYTDAATYGGLDPDVAAAIEPSLTWTTDVPASVGVISINLATDNDVVMSTTSVTGQVLCIADHIVGSDYGTYYGRIDAHGATDAISCAGGW